MGEAVKRLVFITVAVVTWVGNVGVAGLWRGTVMWVVFFGGGYWIGVFFPWKRGARL